MTASPQIAEEVKKHLQNKAPAMEEFLRQLVYRESPSHNKAAIEELMTYLQAELRALGYVSFRYPGKETGGFLYARPLQRERNKPLQVLVGHCDTVWALNTIEKMPVQEKNGKITGPGIYDMKAGLTQIIFALRTLKELSLSVPVTPIVLINADEEIGSRESTRAIARLARISNRAFILEPPLGLEGKIKTSRKGVGRFTIKVQGKAAHAGLDPEKGVSAIVELSHQVQKLYAMNDLKRGITVNVGMVTGGTSANVIAAESTAVVDVRIYNKEDADYITEQIYALKPEHEDVTLEVSGGIGRQPMEKNPRNENLWQRAKAGGELLDIELQEATAGGGSDGNTTSLYTATLDGLGTTGDGAHAVHEFIFKEKLTERTALLVILLLEVPLKL